ncbi:glycoside hydrolase family 15 protein [Ktedonobacter racemifer]|uniref:Glycoside hydrolase 15-related protein n=1 Tax=Ktedonobacter racemifer DSM 44963 TaxID=485913 RepID=D6TGP7_KTERA|nr:glycoside hydrolase family 15 protein [Ktedonobacter racemifer]EFH90759.1 glycoside hydrolase 15-related protein [Ktedonobacter racemifer DSM 44963]
MSTLPIADYGLLSDCRSSALVSRMGSVDWLCFPRFDGPSVFARLLGEQAGHWSISATDPSEVSRRYLDRTMAIETTFSTPTGRAVLVDAMAIGRNERGHNLGANSPSILLRSVSCVSGTVDMELEYVPRFEYGLISPLLRPIRGGIVARGGADVLVLSSPVQFHIENSLARTRFTLKAGKQARFALQYRTSWEAGPQVCSQATIAAYLHDTLRGWRTWSDLHQKYKGPWRELVHQSGRVLQAFMFRPTGAIVAAPTTSLPESIGGERNWDYRYTWVRDACLTLEALWVAACPYEAYQFFNWMANAVAAPTQQEAGLQIMFGVGGEHDLSERTLSHLAGWRASQPVRIGNGAWQQHQLDVYGELLSAVRRLRDEIGTPDETTRHFLIKAADAAAAHWQEPDQGIWEMRGRARDFLYSKLMCWVALDCAIALVDLLRASDHIDAWTATRKQIRDAILTHGWSEKAGAFTQAFGSDDLDASALMMPIVGFLPAIDPRMRATIDAIAERLTDAHGLVYRYRVSDGLAGEEGTFLLCTFWLAHALALAGEVERASATFERAAACANDIGLLAEEVDSASGELLGNFPQAFSHIGLVNAAWAISQAR